MDRTDGRLPRAQINAKKTAINGHLDHRGCQSWNNSFGFNNKPGNYVPTLVVNADTGAISPVGAPRNNCLPAALVYDPVTNPTVLVAATRTSPSQSGGRPPVSPWAARAPCKLSTTSGSSTGRRR